MLVYPYQYSVRTCGACAFPLTHQYFRVAVRSCAFVGVLARSADCSLGGVSTDMVISGLVAVVGLAVVCQCAPFAVSRLGVRTFRSGYVTY